MSHFQKRIFLILLPLAQSCVSSQTVPVEVTRSLSSEINSDAAFKIQSQSNPPLSKSEKAGLLTCKKVAFLKDLRLWEKSHREYAEDTIDVRLIWTVKKRKFGGYEQSLQAKLSRNNESIEELQAKLDSSSSEFSNETQIALCRAVMDSIASDSKGGVFSAKTYISNPKIIRAKSVANLKDEDRDLDRVLEQNGEFQRRQESHNTADAAFHISNAFVSALTVFSR